MSYTTALFFFFNDTATTQIYTLSLHDALPISRVPPKSKRTTSVDLVMPVARVLVRRRPHGHAPRHPHLVAAALPHVVAIVLLIQRVRAVSGGPLDATVGHEQPAHDAHPAVRDRLAGGIVVVDSHAVAVVRDDVGAESGPTVEAGDRDGSDVSGRVGDRRGAVDHVARRHVDELDQSPVVV